MFIMQSYEQMKNDFTTKLREVVLRRHEVGSVEKLPEPRRQQVQFLEVVIDLLKLYKPEGPPEAPELLKAKILTGIMLILCDEISHDYKYTDPTNSTLFTVLKEVMNLSGENPMDNLTERRLMEVAEKFLVNAIYIEGKLGKDLRPDHPFTKIQGFNLLDFYSRLLKIKYDASLVYMKSGVEKLDLQTKTLQEERSSFLGLGSWFRKAAPPEGAAPSSDAAAQKNGATSDASRVSGSVVVATPSFVGNA